jgi:hypothetical protein
MWCGECYTSSDKVKFPVTRGTNAPGQDESDEDRARLDYAWRRRPQARDDFMKARNGDHYLIPFQCDLCVFRVLRHQDPIDGHPKDELLLACIRRVNLDAFWSRASSTVKANTDRLRFCLKLSEMVGLQGPYIQEGPLPSYDYCGYEVAIQMVLHSLRPGRYSPEYTQFETIRKDRSCFSNQVRASSKANRQILSMGDAKGSYQRFNFDGCGSLLFSAFIDGCRFRMGNDWRPNQVFGIPLLKKILETVDDMIEESLGVADKNRWVVFHSYCVVSYVVSLRGTEGLLLDLDGLNRHWPRNEVETCIILALLGRVKGQHHDKCHLFPCVFITDSGINVKRSIERLLEVKRSQGFVEGPAISDEQGRALTTRAIDDCLQEVLQDLFVSNRELFPKHIEEADELKSKYQAFRSFRRTSASQALNKGVSEDDIDIVNRWKKFEAAGGKRPSLKLRHHYADVLMMPEPFLRYTQAM